MATVLGVDATKAGWVGVIVSDAECLGAVTGTRLDELLGRANDKVRSKGSAVPDVSVMAIDMPIGLPDGEEGRRADDCARTELKGRARSVFSTPVREAVFLDPYEAASLRNLELSGKKMTRQAYGLCKKIRQVDAWVPTAPVRVVEVHPELSFATLAGKPMLHSKKTWVGAHERRRRLEGEGIILPDALDDVGDASIDDVLDAAVAAWSAQQVSRGKATRYPKEPQHFNNGIDAVIWA